MSTHRLIIDANLLVLLVSGRLDPTLVDRHKNLSVFGLDGLDLLEEIINEHSEIVLTPNTLTEASNLLRQIGEPLRTQLTQALGVLISTEEERYIVSRDVCSVQSFRWLGLTDATLLLLAEKEGGVILSTDANLCIAAGKAGLIAVNFNHRYEQREGL